MKPLTKYLKNLFAFQRITHKDASLKGLTKADAILNRLVAEKKIPGLSITVLKKGKVLLQKGYGYADIEHQKHVYPKKTIFRIASVSKPIAATALAHMVSEGLINLDASFYKYVPYYPKKKYDFTIRQLASHTAGIRSYKGKEYALNMPFSIKESIEVFAHDDLCFEPGTDYLYNSFDWVLISLAMQEASGIPFEEYVQEKVLNPLLMTNTFAESCPVERSRDLITDKESNLTTFYSKNRLGFRKAIPVNNYFKLAGGGYLSTSEDIANFGQAYLDEKILNQKVLSPFLTSETIQAKKTYYGLGWQVSEDKKGRPFYGHVGNGVGGYSNFFVYPKEETVFSILINCTDPKVQEDLDEVINALFYETEHIS